LAALVALGSAWGQGPRFGGVRVELRPNPRVVPADGQTASTVRAELRDSNNRPVPDGTMVVFRMEGGSLGTGGGERRSAVTVATVGGAATVFATSTQVGTATLYAEVMTGEGRNQVQIYFTEEGAAAIEEGRVLHVKGGWVGYAYELDLVEARAGEEGRAQLSFGPVQIEAEVAQVAVDSLQVRAAEATIIVGEKRISAQDLYYDLLSGQGRGRRVGEAGVERFGFNCYTMQEEPLEEESNGELFRLDSREAATWAVARSISVYPYQKIVFRNGAIYVEGQRILRLPKYWLIARPGYSGTTHSQMLSVSSDGKIGLDFPYVYRVSDTRTSSVKLQRGAPNGSIIAREDWSLALEEAYETRRVRGEFSVVGLPYDDWGVEWTDSRELGARSEGHFTAYTPDHRSVYVDSNVYQWGDDFRLNLRGYYDRPHEVGDSYGVSADWLSYNRPLGNWASYRIGTGLGVGHVGDSDRGLVGEHQVYVALDFARRELVKGTTLTPTLSNLFAWDTTGYRYDSVRGELALRTVISSQAVIGLSYQAQYSSGDDGRGFEHLLDLSFNAYRGSIWQTYLAATYQLDDGDTYAYGLFDYYPDPRWRVGVGATYYRFDDTSFNDLEVSVGRRFEGREIGLRWSKALGTVSLELGGFGGVMGF